jgi:hypothetical protein
MGEAPREQRFVSTSLQIVVWVFLRFDGYAAARYLLSL